MSKDIMEYETEGVVIKPDEFIFCKNKSGDITSCGYQISSPMLREDTDRFGKNGIPVGIFYIPPDPKHRFESKYEEEEHEDEIDDDLYQKLMMLAELEGYRKRDKLMSRKLHGGSKAKAGRKTKKNKKVD